MSTSSALRSLFGFAAFAAALTSTQAGIQMISAVGQMDSQKPMTLGFTIAGSQDADVLLRFAGPTFGLFTGGGAVTDPRLTLFKDGTQVGFNDNWSSTLTSTFAAAGLFPFMTGSADAALRLMLAPGEYTAQFDFSDTAMKMGLIDLVSLNQVDFARGYIESNIRSWATGFVVTSTTDLLLRAIGTEAAPGVTPNASLNLSKNFNPQGSNDNWGTAPNATAISGNSAAVGFAPLNTLDAALLQSVAPSPYTAVISGPNLNRARLEFADLQYRNAVKTPDALPSLALFGLAMGGLVPLARRLRKA